MAQRLILLLLLPLLTGWHWFEPAARRNQKGIEAYRRGEFTEALELFLSAKGLKSNAPALANNTAAALYQLKKYPEAFDEFSHIEAAKLKADAPGLHYNLGNALYRLGRFPEALESYKRCLRLDPGDIQAKKNFELTLKKIQEEQEPQPNPQQQDQAEDEQQKHEAVMQFLDQNERKQMEKKKRKTAPVRNEKDW
ncbi:MAG: tetratricopeptide repeat protein [Candidatus Aminicenantes bacterium]|nr:tetratricopeptide repeat protein [Candidatus Aminicenantes bacterium]